MKKREAYYSVIVNKSSSPSKRAVRKDLNADVMIQLVGKEFRGIRTKERETKAPPVRRAHKNSPNSLSRQT